MCTSVHVAAQVYVCVSTSHFPPLSGYWAGSLFISIESTLVKVLECWGWGWGEEQGAAQDLCSGRGHGTISRQLEHMTSAVMEGDLPCPRVAQGRDSLSWKEQQGLMSCRGWWTRHGGFV